MNAPIYFQVYCHRVSRNGTTRHTKQVSIDSFSELQDFMESDRGTPKYTIESYDDKGLRKKGLFVRRTADNGVTDVVERVEVIYVREDLKKQP